MKLIVIEGTDGSGKSHHTDALAASLVARGLRARAWHEAREAPDFHEWVGLTRVAYAEAFGTWWAGDGFDANGSEVTG